MNYENFFKEYKPKKDNKTKVEQDAIRLHNLAIELFGESIVPKMKECTLGVTFGTFTIEQFRYALNQSNKYEECKDESKSNFSVVNEYEVNGIARNDAVIDFAQTLLNHILNGDLMKALEDLSLEVKVDIQDIEMSVINLGMDCVVVIQDTVMGTIEMFMLFKLMNTVRYEEKPISRNSKMPKSYVNFLDEIGDMELLELLNFIEVSITKEGNVELLKLLKDLRDKIKTKLSTDNEH